MSAYAMVWISAAEKFSSAASRLAACFCVAGLKLVVSHQKVVARGQAVVVLVGEAL